LVTLQIFYVDCIWGEDVDFMIHCLFFPVSILWMWMYFGGLFYYELNVLDEMGRGQ